MDSNIFQSLFGVESFNFLTQIINENSVFDENESNEFKDRIKNIPQNVDRYKKLLEAYNYHKQFFGSEYTEDDFFNIATFQNRISGNPNKEEVGGTGLTYLIKSLQEKSDSDDFVVIGCDGVWECISNEGIIVFSITTIHVINNHIWIESIYDLMELIKHIFFNKII